MEKSFFSFKEGCTPILLEMPHSGILGLHTPYSLTPFIAGKVNFNSPEVRKTIGFGCDAAVPAMSGYIHLMQYGLSGIRNDLARVFCDTNREEHEISGLALEGADNNKGHHGIVWARTVPVEVDLSLPREQLEEFVRTKCEPLLQKPYTLQEFSQLISEVYYPYHATIKRLHKKAVEKHGFCIHLALHSLPPVSIDLVNGGYVCGQKAKRGPYNRDKGTLPDVILIHNNFEAAERSLVETVRIAFESAGLLVEDGQGPFVGSNGVTKMYGNPYKGLHVIGIEHVTHETEPLRYLGNPTVNLEKAKKFQYVYEKAVMDLLHHC